MKRVPKHLAFTAFEIGWVVMFVFITAPIVFAIDVWDYCMADELPWKRRGVFT